MASDELDVALELRKDGDLEGATEAFNEIIDTEGPDEAEAWLWLAETWQDRKEPETAIASYREALKLDLGDLHGQARLGLAHALVEAGLLDEATSVIDDTDTEDDTDTAAALERLRDTITRTRLVQRYDPLHLLLCLFGLLCVAGTFLPWVSVSYEDVFSGAKDAGTFNGWQVTTLNSILICVCAGVLIVHVLRARLRGKGALWLAVADIALSACGVVGAVFAVLVLNDVADAHPFAFERPFHEIADVGPHLGFYLACAFVLVHAALGVTALVRTMRR